MIRERAVQFGDNQSLVGVLCEARQDGSGDPGIPAFLILNAGILHHVGPSRIHVTLARRLAAKGFSSLRFDFSGIGDSEPRTDGMHFDEAATAEVGQAMDFLSEKRGISRFVAGGICSGADASFWAARKDSRVIGLFQVDGFAYRNAQYYLHHYGSRLLQWQHWKSFTLRQIHRVGRVLSFGESRTAGPPQEPTEMRNFPPKKEVEGALRSLVERKVRQLHIYSAGQQEHYNHASQFHENFRPVDFRGMARVEYLKEADHTFTDLDQQRALVDLITDWASGLWGAETCRAEADRSGGDER